MRRFILAAAAVLFATQASAQPAPAPRLLVVISVDQFSANLWDEYRPQFSGGFARLAQGTVFRNGYQSHALTETCPGHSTILTGDHPARTGIINNFWVDQSIGRSDKSVYCAEDETQPGTSSTAYKVSPRHLLVPTLGELMKDRWQASRSVAVSGKDRAAVMMTGHKVDQRWYWTGHRLDTDLRGVPVPAAVGKVNQLVGPAVAGARQPLEPTPFCQAKARAVPIENSQKSVGTGTFARAPSDENAYRASPDLDAATLALAAALLEEMQLGRKGDPDLLAVSLSATDYVGHAYGTEGQEMCVQLTELDRDLEGFLDVLDRSGIDYAVALTADHGGLDTPERMRLAGIGDAARVDPGLSAKTMGQALVQKLGLSGPGLLGDSSFGDMYVDRSLSPRGRKRLLDAAVAAYRLHPQVEAVFTAKQIAATPKPTGSPDKWTLIQRLRASYYPGRSGDFLVVLKKDITPIFDTSRSIATHGSAWDYDRRVPVIFWRKGIAGSSSESVVDTVDIMPTLAAWLGIPLARGAVDGHCLSAVAQCPGASAPVK